MHCSANVGKDGKSAIFFGLSGTGKTTLSADATRTLIGDDEHGWSEHGVFNFEGGCYAKVIKLSREAEPEIYLDDRALRHRARKCGDGSGRRASSISTSAHYAENTRAAYPIDFIPNASETGRAGHPKNVIMLTADAFGVLPPIAKLTPSQAMYHFLSGFTAKVAGTEKGLGKEPQPTFSTCFGAPFMPRHPSRIRQSAARPDRRSTRPIAGWSIPAGPAAPSAPARACRSRRRARCWPRRSTAASPMSRCASIRISDSACRSRCRASTPRSSIRATPGPTRRPMTRRPGSWSSMFRENFKKFEAHVGPDVLQAAPHLAEAAE